MNPRTGSVKFNFPGAEQGPASCALDIADRGGATLEQVGDALGIVRERVRQIETVALAKLNTGVTRGAR